MKNKAKKISGIIPGPELGPDQRPERCNCQGNLVERIAVCNDSIGCEDLITLVVGKKKKFYE